MTCQNLTAGWCHLNFFTFIYVPLIETVLIIGVNHEHEQAMKAVKAASPIKTPIAAGGGPPHTSQACMCAVYLPARNHPSSFYSLPVANSSWFASLGFKGQETALRRPRRSEGREQVTRRRPATHEEDCSLRRPATDTTWTRVERVNPRPYIQSAMSMRVHPRQPGTCTWAPNSCPSMVIRVTKKTHGRPPVLSVSARHDTPILEVLPSTAYVQTLACGRTLTARLQGEPHVDMRDSPFHLLRRPRPWVDLHHSCLSAASLRVSLSLSLSLSLGLDAHRRQTRRLEFASLSTFCLSVLARTAKDGQLDASDERQQDSSGCTVRCGEAGPCLLYLQRAAL